MAHAPAPATKPFYLAEFVQPGRPLLAEVPLSCEPYRVKRCAACRSPNTYRGITCTKCGHSLADPGCVVDERDCPFCVVVRAVPHGLPADGAAIEVLGETVRFADDEILIVDAKFPISKFQLNVIPRRHIADLDELDAIEPIAEARIRLLDRLYRAGRVVIARVLANASHPWQETLPEDLCDGSDEGGPVASMTLGFNSPPSVPHLHLYMIPLPYNFTPEAVASFFFIFPRSKLLTHVLHSLRTRGVCYTGAARADDALERERHERDVAALLAIYAARYAELAAQLPTRSDFVASYLPLGR